MSSKVSLVQRPNYPLTWDWKQKGKQIATITLYEDGLVEFSGTHAVAIECVGQKDEVVGVNDVNIR